MPFSASCNATSRWSDAGPATLRSDGGSHFRKFSRIPGILSNFSAETRVVMVQIATMVERMFAGSALGPGVVLLRSLTGRTHGGEERPTNRPTPRPFLSVTSRCQRAFHLRLREAS